MNDRQQERKAFALFMMLTALMVMPISGQATILEFDQIRESGIVIPTISGRAVEQDYGDRAAAATVNVSGGQFTYGSAGEGYTPNVVLDYFSGIATPANPGVSTWADDYGDLHNAIIGGNNSLSLNVRFTADTGYEVQLYHFDLAGWPNADYIINGVSIVGDSAILYSQSNVLVEGDLNGVRRTAFDFSAPLSAQELLIQIDYSNLGGGSHDNIGIDNIRFGQNPPAAVPLPPAWLMLGSGLLAMLARVRKGIGFC